jgi:hypothetical protein
VIGRSRGPRPRKRQPPVRSKADACSQSLTVPIEGLLQPAKISVGCADQPKPPNLQGNHFKPHKVGAGGIEAGKIHEREIVAKLLMAVDAFVVIQEITCVYRKPHPS